MPQPDGPIPSPVAAVHPAVAARLGRLSPDQRAAATAPPGPVLCVAPAGSGKTTTLVARVAWLVDRGVAPATVAAITFNKRAAEELEGRLAEAIAPLGLAGDAVRVRTFHALGREILRDAGRPVEPLVDRARLLRALSPGADTAARTRLDDAISRRKLDPGAWAAAAAAMDPADRGAAEAAIDAYERAVRATGGVDFDDLVAGALRALETDRDLLARWRGRCGHLLVDEVQDVDASQLRLALLLAAPADRIFLVGDDDQSIYGWRLADVRRVLGLAAQLPGLRRTDLVTNRRCPAVVVERAVRLVEHNQERFAKRVRASPTARGSIVLVPEGADEEATLRRVISSWPPDGTHAVLARTNRELLAGLSVALALGIPFRADRIPELATDPRVDRLLEAATRVDPRLPTGARILAAARGIAAEPPSAAAAGEDEADAPPYDALVAAVVAWLVRWRTLDATAAAVADTRARLAELRRDDAALTLATAHATKGLEFDDVAVVGMSEGRFPSARSLADAADPGRALEEERRLAYVAWTRAKRSLTLVFDPAAPSRFVREAFDADELPAVGMTGAARPPAPGAPAPPR
jgi:superfamily I DNA/RNA helicase